MDGSPKIDEQFTVPYRRTLAVICLKQYGASARTSLPFIAQRTSCVKLKHLDELEKEHQKGHADRVRLGLSVLFAIAAIFEAAGVIIAGGEVAVAR